MKNVLIADDEKSFLLSLQDGFKVHEDRFTVLTAENGQEAVTILENHKVDLLITDLEMPLMNGFELLAWTSRELPQLPIIVMTAFGTPEIESQLAAYESIRYLEKPLDLPTLEKAIFNGLAKDYKSYIQGITPASFLQLLQLEKKTCTLKVTSVNRTGYLYLMGGNLIDAEYDGLTGEQAAYRIVCWEQSEIELDTVCERQEGEITETLESILLNAHKIKDEHLTTTEEPPDTGTNMFALPDEEQVDSPDSYLEELVKTLKTHNTVAAAVLFDQHGTTDLGEYEQPGMQEFDPTFFFHLSGNLEALCELGPCRSICFSTAGRMPYLLFPVNEYSVLIQLKKGARAPVVRTELGQIIQGVIQQ